MTFMPIDSIEVDRQLRPDDNVEDLAKSILDQGLKFPVLIREDMYLIDGLRRLEAARLAGFTSIEVVIARTVDEVAAALRASHAELPQKLLHYPPWRINHIWRSTITLPRATNLTIGEHPSRTVIAEALHLSSSNLLQSTVYTYKMAKDPGGMGDVARNAVKLMEAGEINGYGGRMRLYNYRDQFSRVDETMTKQRANRVLTQAVANLVGIVGGLETVPPGLESEALDKATAKQLWTSLEDVKKVVSAISGRIRRVAQSEETNE